MIPKTTAKLKKNKKRRILVISAGGVQGGIQAIYFGMNETWEIHSSVFMPYPQKVSDIIENFIDVNIENPPLADLGRLDFKMTLLYAECAKNALAQVSGGLKKPDLIVLTKLSLWKGSISENHQQANWNLSAGDEQYLSNTFKVPVVTDFIRQNILAGGPGLIPSFPGNLAIASRYPGISGISAMINIGLVSRLTIIDESHPSALIDSDTGPGTCLINKVAKADTGTPDQFDRDGSTALKGIVDRECLKKFKSFPWFETPAPKQASPDIFDSLIEEQQFKCLNMFDKMATITALTASSIYDFYKKEFRSATAPQIVWISGGGVYNMAIVEYLKTLFEPLPVKSIEELGIPADMRIPLALGLTVNAMLDGQNIPLQTGSSPIVETPARWVFPA
jgi:anhydro-N-acetylmuramic acid kinase